MAAITNKQDSIAEELERRITSGAYQEKLPKALDLAAEFEVNFKTLNKAIHQLVAQGLVYRKPGLGTFIVQEKTRLEDSLIELLFVGSSEMSVHPFYSEMWRGVLDSINGSGFKIVLTMLEEDTQAGGIKQICRDFTASAGKILIGTSNAAQIKRLKQDKFPFVLLGEKSLDPEVVSVYTDTSGAIDAAVEYLRKHQVKDIAYIGVTRSEGEHLLDLEKFHAYLAAVQKKGELDSVLIENAPPLAKYGYEVMKNILSRKLPQAVIVAYDHLAPGIYEAINEAGLNIPEDINVIGIDGINPNVVPSLTSIAVDRYAMGYKTGTFLLEMIRNPGKNKYKSIVLNASFQPDSGQSVTSRYRPKE